MRKVFFWSKYEYMAPARLRTGSPRMGARLREAAASRGVEVSANALTLYYSLAQQDAMMASLLAGEKIRLVFALKETSAGADFVDIG